MERKLKPVYVQQFLLDRGVRLFSPADFQRVFGVSLRAAQECIKDHRHDLFLKIRNGLYTLRAAPAQEESVANRLYAPSYISFEYALSRYSIIPESTYTITSATTRITREFTVNGRAFTYSRIKKQAYRGYRTEKIDGVTMLMAVPEKALVDYLYFVDLKRKTLNGRLSVRGLKRNTLMEYAKLFGRESLIELVRKVL